MLCDFSGPTVPDARALYAVLQGATQAAQTKRLAEDMRMERYVHDQRMGLRLRQHLVELVDDGVGEHGGRPLAMDDGLGVVGLDRIRQREERARAGAQPHRLVVHRPVHEVAVAQLFQKVGRVRSLVRAGAEPARRSATFVARNRLGDLAQDALLVGLPQSQVVLGVGAPVGDQLIAAPADGVGDLRCIVVHEAVGAVPCGQAELVEQLERAPYADPVAVVPPGIVSVRLRLADLRRIVAEPRAEGEPLDVRRKSEREPLAERPRVRLAFGKGAKIVARVLRQQPHSTLAPDAFTTGASFAISRAVAVSNASGVMTIGSAPRFCHTGCISLDCTALAKSSLSLRTSARSMPFGPRMPE